MPVPKEASCPATPASVAEMARGWVSAAVDAISTSPVPVSGWVATTSWYPVPLKLYGVASLGPESSLLPPPGSSTATATATAAIPAKAPAPMSTPRGGRRGGGAGAAGSTGGGGSSGGEAGGGERPSAASAAAAPPPPSARAGPSSAPRAPPAFAPPPGGEGLRSPAGPGPGAGPVLPAPRAH